MVQTGILYSLQILTMACTCSTLVAVTTADGWCRASGTDIMTLV